jgi:hypothetical protein
MRGRGMAALTKGQVVRLGGLGALGEFIFVASQSQDRDKDLRRHSPPMTGIPPDVGRWRKQRFISLLSWLALGR